MLILKSPKQFPHLPRFSGLFLPWLGQREGPIFCKIPLGSWVELGGAEQLPHPEQRGSCPAGSGRESLGKGPLLEAATAPSGRWHSLRSAGASPEGCTPVGATLPSGSIIWDKMARGQHDHCVSPQDGWNRTVICAETNGKGKALPKRAKR